MSDEEFEDWESRIKQAWDKAGELPDEDVSRQVIALSLQRPGDDAAALYEQAAAYDFLDAPDDAEPLYRAAISAGLDDKRKPKAVIQLASTLRNLGRLEESIDLLSGEISYGENEWLADVVEAFKSLALFDLGRPREALSVALLALVNHLPDYGRAIREYVEILQDPEIS